jgi:hypothetical protein
MARHRYAGSAAFARQDVADAHRRHPEADLGGYAATRGLESLGSRSAAGYFAAMPGEDDLQFNALRGELSGGVKASESGLRLEVRDGVFAAWTRRDAPGSGSPLGDLGPMVELVADGVAAGREQRMI